MMNSRARARLAGTALALALAFALSACSTSSSASAAAAGTSADKAAASAAAAAVKVPKYVAADNARKDVTTTGCTTAGAKGWELKGTATNPGSAARSYSVLLGRGRLREDRG
jgi:hypothetical protein